MLTIYYTDHQSSCIFPAFTIALPTFQRKYRFALSIALSTSSRKLVDWMCLMEYQPSKSQMYYKGVLAMGFIVNRFDGYNFWQDNNLGRIGIWFLLFEAHQSLGSEDEPSPTSKKFYFLQVLKNLDSFSRNPSFMILPTSCSILIFCILINIYRFSLGRHIIEEQGSNQKWLQILSDL